MRTYCAIAYLRENYELDKSFTANSRVEMNRCSEAIEDVQSENDEELRELIEDDVVYSQDVECMLEQLGSFSTADYFMIYNFYSEDESMKLLKKSMATFLVGSHIRARIELASALCFPDDTFNDLFEETFKLVETTPKYNATLDDLGDLQLDFCMRQHLVDNNLFDINTYKVILNPKNVNTTGLDCKKLYYEYLEEWTIALKDKFETAISPSLSETRCMANKIRQENFVARSLKVWILGELQLSDKQKAAEKTEFINYMTNLYQKIMKCVKAPTS